MPGPPGPRYTSPPAFAPQAARPRRSRREHRGAQAELHYLVMLRRHQSSSQSGQVWSRPRPERSQVVRRVCEQLERQYGRPRLGNPRDPISDLAYIIISNRTASPVAQRVYRRLRRRTGSWDAVVSAPLATIRELLQPAGLSHIKARQLRGALRKIQSDWGALDLRRLRGRTADEIEAYLVQLPGVSQKVAKCVMLYAFDHSVLPVDTHVHRVATRLGWTGRKRADQSHEELESLVPAHRRYVFHVGCIVHGRRVCRPQKPLCGSCILRQHCLLRRGND